MFSCSASLAQDSSSTFINKILSLPDKVFGKIDRKTSALETKLTGKTEKYLARLEKQEQKLKSKLLRRGDTAAAMEIFGNTSQTYQELKSRAQQKRSTVSNLTSYSPHADSLSNAFEFLKQNELIEKNKAVAGNISNSLAQVQQLQTKFNQTETLRKYLQQRQRYLKEKMQQVGLVKEYKKFQKQVYYYQAQVNEYKQAFENPALYEKKIMGLLSKVPAFQNFFAQNSQLASVFQLPGAGGGLANAATVNTAFPTRAMVQQNLMTRLGSSADPSQVIQQGMQNGNEYLNSLKNKLKQTIGGSGSDLDMPDFKVNNQKTKSFWKRLEFGTNLQTVKSNLYFPNTSDVGVSAGFKLSDKSIIGIGATTKIGWGTGWNNINITSQGAGLRSFFDIKIKGGFWASGGAEMNYRPVNNFLPGITLPPFGELGRGLWQKSALLGISKKYNIGKKWKGNAQLLYDFLWKQQLPQTQAFVFRIGYHF